MAARTRQRALAVSLLVLLAACSTNGSVNSGSTSSSSPDTSMTPGMKVTPGMKMRDASTRSGPSSAARMVCSQEIRSDIQRKLPTSAVPSGAATWANTNTIYTCTYRLPVGPLVLSVQDAANVIAGQKYFRSTRQIATGAQPLQGLAGLGLPSFQTSDGSVVFLKDGKTLTVDASRLPNRIGASHLSRTDLAYAIAADVVACWSE